MLLLLREVSYPQSRSLLCKFFLWKHWILEKPGLFNFPRHANELSQAVCEFNVQEPQELSDHSPSVQARGAAHL